MEESGHTVIMYVPGARAVSSRNTLLQRFITFSYGLFNFRPGPDDADEWVRYLREEGGAADIVHFRWERSIRRSAIRRAGKALANTIAAHTGSDIYLIGSSIGCEVALRAALSTGAVRGMVLICPTHRPRRVDGIPVTVFDSALDSFVWWGQRLLYPSSWFSPQLLQGDTVTIKEVPFRHEQFIPREPVPNPGEFGRAVLHALFH